MAYMKHRVIVETINGENTVRYSGNNSAGVREGGRARRRPAYYITKAQKSHARKAAKESAYRERYLDG